ncbi:MAG: serine/threonine protein kinase [Chloroflexaceae bacterium]|nr:serine/threonine protein kinase [Chloroflexaceae bacterium]
MDPYNTVPLRGHPGAEALPPGTLLAERFVLERRLARTAMSAVYRAHDTFTDTPCIVKCLAPTRQGLSPAAARRTFIREACILARLDGPFPSLIWLDRDTFGWYLVETFFEGATLAQILASGRPPVEAGLAIALDLVEAVAAIHRAGLVHADLHPGNIIVQRGNEVKLVDLGLARPIGVELPDLRGAGVPGYASPEQIAGEPLDESTDVYTLSIVLSELLEVGQLPAYLRIILNEAQAPLRAERRVGLADVGRALRLSRGSHIATHASRHNPRSALRLARRRRAIQGAIMLVLAIVLAVLLLLVLVGIIAMMVGH